MKNFEWNNNIWRPWYHINDVCKCSGPCGDLSRVYPVLEVHSSTLGGELGTTSRRSVHGWWIKRSKSLLRWSGDTHWLPPPRCSWMLFSKSLYLFQLGNVCYPVNLRQTLTTSYGNVFQERSASTRIKSRKVVQTKIPARAWLSQTGWWLNSMKHLHKWIKLSTRPVLLFFFFVIVLFFFLCPPYPKHRWCTLHF